MAANSIGSAALFLSLHDGELQQGLNRAKAKVNSFFTTQVGGSAITAGGQFGAVLAGINLAVSAAMKLVSIIANELSAAFARAAELSKAVSLTGLSPEKLSAFGYAASQSNSSLEEMLPALKKFEEMMGEVRHGTQKGKEAMNDLGLSWKQVAQQPIEKQFQTVTDAIAHLNDTQDRNAAIMENFGLRSGTTLAELLGKGSKGIKALEDEAKSLGLTVSKMELNKIREASNEWSKLGSQLSAMWTHLLAEVSGEIKALGQMMIWLFDIIRFAVKGIITILLLASDTIADGLSKVFDAIALLLSKIPLMGRVSHAFHLLAEEQRDLIESNNKHIASMWDATGAELKRKEALERLAASQKAYNGLMNKINQDANTAGMTTGQKAIAELENLTDAQRKSLLAAEAWKEGIVGAWSFVDKISPVEKMKQDMAALNELFNTQKIDKNQYLLALNKMVEKAHELNKAGPKSQQLSVAGSSESIVSIINAQQNARASPQQELVNFARTQNELTQKQLEQGALLLQAFNKGQIDLNFTSL